MGIKVDLKINKDWLYADGGEHSFAVAKFITECKGAFGDGKTEVENRAFDGCSLYITTDMDEDGISEKLDALLTEKIKVPSGDVYLLTVNGKKSKVSGNIADKDKKDKKEDTSEGREPEKKKADPESDHVVKSADSSEKNDIRVLHKIDSLVGAESFKKLCNDIYSRSEMIKKNKSQEAFFSQSYLFFH